jgi:hypothetical protein
MKRYRAGVHYTIFGYVVVEAETEEAAERRVYQRFDEEDKECIQLVEDREFKVDLVEEEEK